MRTLRAALIRLAEVFRRQRGEQEFAAELESHLQIHIEDNLRAGMSLEQARRNALMKLGGVELPVRANLGLYTQPISFIGLPVVVAPLQRPGGLPIGVQIIANHYKEAAALRVARHLEKEGVASAPAA